MRNIKKWNIASRFAILLLLVIFVTQPAFAASSVVISGGENVKSGDMFTVNVDYQGDNIGSVTANLTYDTSALEYISGGSSSGNTGYVYLQKDVVGEKMSFQIKFRAKKEGDAKLQVETYEMYDEDYRTMSPPSTSSVIYIEASATEETSEEETTATETVDVATDSNVDNEVETQGVNPLILGGIAVVLLLLIILIIVKLKKKS